MRSTTNSVGPLNSLSCLALPPFASVPSSVEEKKESLLLWATVAAAAAAAATKE